MVETLEKNNQMMLKNSRASLNQDHLVKEISKQLDQLSSTIKSVEGGLKRLDSSTLATPSTSIDGVISEIRTGLSTVADKQEVLSARVSAKNAILLQLKDAMSRNDALDEISEHQKHLIDQQVETNNFMATLRDDISAALMKSPGTPPVSNLVEITKQNVTAVTDSDGWKTFTSGKRMWKKRWTNQPQNTRPGSFRYSSNDAPNKPVSFERRVSTRKSNKRLAPTPLKNPEDIENFDEIIAEFATNSYPNLVPYHE